VRPAHTALLTPWGEALDPEHPLPEYPRPQLRRDSYLNLNGVWDHAFRISATQPAQWEGPIVVPFSPESLLSGVGRQLQPGEYLHYARSFEAPPVPAGHRVLLHFGAVDQSCHVRVNGRSVGGHEGGYVPFTFDITDALSGGENRLHVVVTDPSDTGIGSRGKQRLRPGGIWYTAQSGIWQTVWLEVVPHDHITALALEPDLTGFTVTVSATGQPSPCQVRVSAQGSTVLRATTSTGSRHRIEIPEPRLWSPEDPFRYDLEVTVGDDEVRSYVGLRTFGVGIDSAGHTRLLLNDRPYFHAGVLDQGYWSDGLYTAPSDAALVHDIATMKDLGFTMLRKHIKVEPLRWYYHCDRLGMLVWQDMVNGGGRYRRRVVEVPAVTPLRLKDSHHRLFARSDAAGRAQWLDEMRDTVEHLRNSPSIAAWVPFNEGWGQFDANSVAREVARLDPSRPIDHASGWHDQGGGDFRSLHIYFRPFRVPRTSDGRVLALSEYGGYSLHLAAHSASGTEFGYRRYGSVAMLTRAFRALHTSQILPAIPKGLSATVYTQLSDVEDETNGLLTYDRRVLKIPAEDVRAVITRLRLDGG
jgi:Glycosyl hydrolases family 2, sugar binding domain/Glycosyl hydrolases family 2, TIM barrel domain/Glycosyl hydrolases family 2